MDVGTYVGVWSIISFVNINSYKIYVINNIDYLDVEGVILEVRSFSLNMDVYFSLLS